MRRYPVILSIAGSDCSGGAGIQADIKTISALGGYAASVITAITVQNTLGVSAVYSLPPEIIRGQLEAVMEDLQPDAIKIGMVDNVDIVRIIADCIQKYKPQYIVYDPVMVSTSGRQLVSADAIDEIKALLLPLATLVTPNLDEANVLTGKKINTPKSMRKEGKELARLYNTSFLVKGGHLGGTDMCDVLSTPEKNCIYCVKRVETTNLHGTGCTLSSAIATFLAHGLSLEESIRQAKSYINQAIIAGKNLEIGRGNGPLWHFHSLTAQK